MKTFLIILVLLAMVFLLSCGEDEEKNEQINKIVHHFFSDCFSTCEYILTIENNNTYFQLYVPKVDSNGKIVKILETDTALINKNNLWNNANNLIDISEFMQLDSFYNYNDSSIGTNGHYDMKIITNKAEKVVRYMKGRKVDEIYELHQFLINLEKEINL